jgi:hypothetical protein
MNKVFVLFLSSIVLLLSACNSDNMKDTLSDMDKWIDPAIQGYERDVMRQVLTGLAPEDRRNVTYTDIKGNEFVNRPELRNATVIYRPSKENPQLLVSDSGDTIAAPPQFERPDSLSPLTYTPSCSKVGTGAYWRSFSAGLRYYKYQSASVSLPATINNYTNIGIGSTLDVPYIYLGGWGPSGSGVDAGLQFNYETRTWSLFTTYSGVVDPDTFSYRFADAQTVSLRFYISNTNQVTVVATGRNAATGVTQTRTKVRAVSGWPLNGYDVVMKALVTVAQAGVPTTDTDGILLRGTFVKNIRIYNRKVASVAAPTSSQLSAITYASGSPCRWITSRVTYTGTQDDATVSIDLRP